MQLLLLSPVIFLIFYIASILNKPKKNNNSHKITASSPTKSKCSNKNRRHKTSGWAKTKTYPHKRHPAKYKKHGSDQIDYLVFTHSDEVNMPNGTKVKTIPLSSNINPAERGKSISHVFPKVFRGKRSALGSEANDFSLTPEDKKTVDKLFDELPVQYVPTTGGENKFKKGNNKNDK